MSFLRRTFVVGLLLAGCSGQIGAGTPAPDPSGQGPTGAPSVTDPVTGLPAGGAGAGAGPVACTPGALPRTRIWRLSHAQLKNTLADVFGYTGTAVDGLPPDARLDGFANRSDKLSLSPLLLEHYFKVGDEIGAEVLRRGGDFIGCPVTGLGEGACLGDFLKKVGRRAWRRPLAEADVAALTGVYTAATKSEGPDAGLKSVITALLLSPNFLYRTELGPPDKPGEIVRLTDFELASALSYMLWDSPPDEALLDLAAAGKLRDPGTLAAEARRLFTAGKRAPDAFNTFMRQWLKVDDLPNQGKDAALFPFYTAEVGRDLLAETRLFFDEVVFGQGGDRSMKTLFTAPRGYANARTAMIYGVDAKGDALAPVALDPKRRRGLLTSGAFLAAHAGADVTKVVDRGAFMREEFLCAEVPAPPQNFKFEDAAITDDMTAREKLLIHAKNPACANCHSLFDGIGFALENYDAVGRFRETERNKKIDPSGVLPLPSGTEVRFENFIDLVDQLTKLPDMYGCFASQYLSYATGRGLREIDACERATLLSAFEKGGHRIDNLVVAIVTGTAFSTRRN